MVVVRLFGGLGNQMFQYAAGRSIAYMNNKVLKLDITSGFREDFYKRKYCLKHFNIEEHIASKSELPRLLINHSESASIYGKTIRFINSLFPLDKKFIYKEKSLLFDPTIFKPRDRIYLIGYWQSEKYFSNIEPIILSEYSFKTIPANRNKEIAERISNDNSVGIHLRRLYGVSGDKVFRKHKKVYGTSSMQYYRNAIEYLQEMYYDLKFYIFSDHMQWVKDNFREQLPLIFVDHNDNESSYEDLRLMSLCKHQIIANSSFSWWAARLNLNELKTIIAPKTWFLDKYKNENNDIIPESWIRM